MPVPPSSSAVPFSPTRVRGALRLSVVDGLLYAIMVGVSESYLGALAVELGHEALALGLLVTVPMLAGALSQLASTVLSARLGSRKRLVVAGAALQGLSHLWLFAIAHNADPRVWPLMGAKLLFWISGSAIAPAWGAWMAELVRGPSRHRFFARRSAAIHLVLVIGFTAAGLFLHGAHGARSELLQRFSLLFLAALLARGASATALALQADPGRGARRPRASTRTALGTALREGRFRVASYLALMMLGAHISVPYFTPYMLRDLGLDYATFAWLTAVSIVSKAVAFPLWQRLAETHGLRRVLFASGVCVASVPWLWAVFDSVPLLVWAQIMSGVAWAGMELSSYQLLLGSAPAHSRLEFLSLSSAMTGVAQVLGAVIGAQLVTHLGLSLPGVFLVSSCARAVPLAVLIARRSWIPERLFRMVLRVSNVRPVGGAMTPPVAEEDVQ